MSAAPLSREERENILWALSCSNGGLTADGVREFIAPWEATVQAAEERSEALRAALTRIANYPGHPNHGKFERLVAENALAADDAKRGAS